MKVDDKDFIQKKKSFKKKLKSEMIKSLSEIMNQIGITSVSKYMTPHKLIQGEYGIPGGSKRISGRKGGKKLGILTSRLSRSILDQEDYTYGRESIRKIISSGSKISAKMGSKVPYAAIHEYGGTIQNNNLFGKGISATIEIPPRPYLNPAVKESSNEINKILEKMAKNSVRVFNE